MKTSTVQIRVVTWNIHKGVRGMGLRRQLQIHDMVHAVEQFDADIVCLQEVRSVNRKEAAHFTRWPELPQADYLAPEGYEAVYRSNAITRHGEHGNALLTRWPVLRHQHEDMSDHRFEQRGLLHSVVMVYGIEVHTIVVHLGLIAASRHRQLMQLNEFIEREVPVDALLVIAGDFNSAKSPIKWAQAAIKNRAPFMSLLPSHGSRQWATFPSQLPLVQLDHIFMSQGKIIACNVPRGKVWAKMSDHLPLIMDFEIIIQNL